MKKKSLLARRIAAVTILLGILGATTFWIITQGSNVLAFFSNGEKVQSWIDEQGALAVAIMFLSIILQTVIAVIPAEPFELAAGYSFGFAKGTALCLAAYMAGTILVVLLTRTLGYRILDLFGVREKVASFKWLQDSTRFETLFFVVFLIPGTPKDPLTYVAAISQMPLKRLLLITTIGRIPNVVFSTLAAGFAAQGKWGAAIITIVVTCGFVVIGYFSYRFFSARIKRGKVGGGQEAQ